MKNITIILEKARNIMQSNIPDCISIIVASFLLFPMERNYPEVIFFDVGQGDAILIQEGDIQILVDGGPDDTILYKLAERMPLYDKKIELLILTHPHDDHIKGLLNVLKEYEIEKILINKITSSHMGYQYMLAKYESKIANVVVGDTIEYGDIRMEVLYPFEDNLPQKSNINNESIVILLSVQHAKILLMGDAEEEVEEEMIKNNTVNPVDILKAGHHCSRTSSSEMFLKNINPRFAICSCGRKNKFGHPHHETLEKFQDLNVQYFLSYEEGDIVIKFDHL